MAGRAQKGQFGACMPVGEILAMRRRIDAAADTAGADPQHPQPEHSHRSRCLAAAKGSMPAGSLPTRAAAPGAADLDACGHVHLWRQGTMIAALPVEVRPFKDVALFWAR